MITDEQCYRAVQSKDPRFDGWFFTAVVTTGIYCRPSCPAMTPKPHNVRFYPTAAAAQLAGFRACKRCRPDATPGSPEWNRRADLVGRAMRLIADGVVDRDGVAGLARRLNYSERQLHRQLVAEVGAGPIALARAQRAQTARILIETTALPVSQIAFAAGFASIRQFNDTIRDVFALTPTALRAHRRTGGEQAPLVTGALSLRLPFRAPLDGAALLEFLRVRSISGVESVTDGVYARSMRLPHGTGLVTLRPLPDHVACTLRLSDLRDLGAAVQRCRRLLDLDADPVAVAAALGTDELLAPLVAKRPGLRAPGHGDGFEIAVRAIVGQQVSVAGARTVLARMSAALGEDVVDGTGGTDGTDGTNHGTDPAGATTGIERLFPSAAAFAEADPEQFPMPRARADTIRRLGAAVADGTVEIDPGADRIRLRESLLAMPGIGPWTVAYIEMRALGDPDVFMATDLGVRRALEHLGVAGDPKSATARAEMWRPWRSYALLHLWTSLSG